MSNRKYTYKRASNLMALFSAHLFELGQLVATSGAIDLLDRMGMNATELLKRHQRGDWGDVSEKDVEANNRAVISGERILSVYELGKLHEPVWVVTEADRSVTTLLLPEEY